MRIGLCGAHRTGKTTLAKLFAEQNGLEFVPTTTSAILESIGVDPKVQYPIQQRLEAQEFILAKLSEQWQRDDCIFDRTPLDVLAYMEADVLRNFPSDELIEKRYLNYRNSCFAQASNFSKLILIQPGISIVEEGGKAPGVLPYIEHLNSLLFGYLAELSVMHDQPAAVLYRDALAMDKRILFIKKCIGDISVNGN